MIKKGLARSSRRRGGFTLIELLVVVLIIGILAAIAVPQYFKVVEKGKFAEATQFLSGLKGAQERYLAKNGVYYSGAITSTSFDADLGVGSLKYFTANAITATTAPNWTITMTRGPAPGPAVYGTYTVTYDRAATSPLVCSGQCATDLAP